MGNFNNQQIAMQANLEQTLVLTFAVPAEELLNYVPEPLTLDIYDNKWAFLAVALVRTKHLRPKGFPKFLGRNFILVGYRIFVRYTTQKGKNLRGLYILGSATDSRLMEIMGNLLTNYHYKHMDIQWEEKARQTLVQSSKQRLQIEFPMHIHDPKLPVDSPFPDWKTARRYAGPLPFTFYINKENKEIHIVEGKRTDWIPNPIHIQHYQIGFLDDYISGKKILASAFSITNIPYYWKKGRVEKWG